MGFEDKYREYGYLEVNGDGVKVYFAPQNYDYIYRRDVVDAYWTGGCTAIIVELRDGSRMRWTSMNDYEWIY